VVVCGGGGGRRERTETNRDAVDICFKLRSPVKIAFDMNARNFDNEIKIYIIL